MALLTEQERERIERAVIEAEANTSGEIVPMVVAASDDYPGARWRVATAFGFLCALVALLVVPDLNPWWIMVGFGPALLVGHLLAARPGILRQALWPHKIDEEVAQRAFEAFMQNNLHATRDRTGVLVFVSMLEHRIQIISDIGIDQKAPEGFWQQVVDELVDRVKKGELADGLVHAIHACGELLSEQFPRRADDENELPDKVIVE